MAPASCQDLGFPYGRHSANERGVDGSAYPFGECTDFCWRFYRDQGVNLNGYMGDATEWIASAGVQHYTVWDRIPATNVIACWDQSAYPPFGHVAPVVDAADDGSYTVHEMNFCYSVDASPGQVDARKVTRDDPQPKGFILPTGAGLGAGAPTLFASTGGLLSGLDQVGKAIEHAGLQAEADIMTLRQRVTSGAQVGMGATIALAGGGVLVLAMLGRSPAGVARAGARQAARVARRRGREALPAIRQHFPESAPQLPEPPVGRPVRIPAARATRILR